MDRPHKVLIVEDDADSSEAFTRILRLRGWIVAQAKTVEEAKNLLGNDYDFVMLDIRLPDGNGLDVLKIIRERNLNPKVIVTTGQSDDEGIGHFWALGIEGVLHKPIDLSTIFHMLNT